MTLRHRPRRLQGPPDISFAAPTEGELTSCLCVTEDRPAFLLWLLWNYLKQDYGPRELVIVDSSKEPAAMPDHTGITIVRCPPGTGVARKRNIAVEAARGEVLTWFDDDDWQHPSKLSILVAALRTSGVLAGPSRSWFVDLKTGRARPHTAHRNVIFNGLAVRRASIDGVRFDEQRERAADTAWVASVRRETRCAPIVVPQVLMFWLCHRTNISNPAKRYVFSHPVGAVREAVGPVAWGDTDQALGNLRRRLESTG